MTQELEKTEITIAGKTFEVPVRYAAGNVLTEGEASALNQTYHENLRNNFAKKVKDAGDDADLVKLQEELDAYAGEYQFGVRAAGTRTVADPVEREAINLAKSRIRELLKAQSKKASAEQVTLAAENLIKDKDGKGAPFWALATKRIEEARAVASAELGDIVSEIPDAPTAAEEAA